MLNPITIQLTDRVGKPVTGAIELRFRGDATGEPTAYEDEEGTKPIVFPADSAANGSFVAWVEAGPYEWRAISNGETLPWAPINANDPTGSLIPGPEGPEGPQGPPGPSMSVSPMRFSSDQSSSPESAQIKLNTEDQTQATTLSASIVNSDGIDIATPLTFAKPGTQIHVQHVSDSSLWQRYEVTSEINVPSIAPRDYPGYVEYPVAWVEGGESILDDDQIYLALLRQGDPGVQGEPGPQGVQGDPGPVGQTGPAGPKGPKGDTGKDGDVGPQGVPGPEGQPGPKGDKGDVGDTGSAGADSTIPGPEGPQGEPGPQGATGDVGPQGAPGPQGPAGADSTVPGPAGPKGDKGDTGAQGAKGDTGAEGPQGIKGDTGAQGSAGPGIATGGTVGQHLVKSGASDYQTGWEARKRNWYAVGDNSGDSATNASTTVWATVKSPVFTAPAAGWYRVRAGFDLLPAGGTNVVVAAALMVDATAARMLYSTGSIAGAYLPFSLQHVVQLTAGQQLKIGYRPVTASRTAALVNSNSVLPSLTVDEVDAPS